MRPVLLEYICCPVCKSPLILQDEKQDKSGSIFTGVLKCKACNNRYPIINSIPRFVEFAKKDINVSVWGEHWKKFGKGNVYDISAKLTAEGIIANGITKQINPQEDKNFFFSYFKNKIVCDLGCGSGQNINLAYSAGARLTLAIDASEDIDVSYGKYREDDTIQFIQADINKLPLKDEVVDFVYSIGVIHHVKDPKTSIKKIEPVLKKDGYFAFTILKKECFLGKIHQKLNPLKPLILKIPKLVLMSVSVILALLLKVALIFYKIVSYLGDKMVELLPYNKIILQDIYYLSFANLVGFWYDVLIAPVYHVFTPDEWRNWLQGAGFKIKKFNDYGQKGEPSGVFWKIVVIK